MQRRNQVVVAFLSLVVERRPLLHGLAQPLPVKHGVGRQGEQLLSQIEQITAVTVGHFAHRGAGTIVYRQVASLLAFGAGQHGHQRLIVETVQHQYLAARQQWRDNFEGGVFRGGADQNNRAVFDKGQQAILLGPIEAVNFIDEQHRALAGLAALAGAGEDLAQVGNTGKHRRHGLEDMIGMIGDQPGNGCLATARRTPQQNRRQPALCQGPAQRRASFKKMSLTDDLGQILRAQAVSEGPGRLGFEKCAHGRRALERLP
jgi:hypothetical protein